MPVFRSVVSVLVSCAGEVRGEDFLDELKAVLGRQPTVIGAGRLIASAVRRSARRATEYLVDNDAGLLMESAT